MTANVVADMSQLMRTQDSVVVVPATAVFAANDSPADASERFVWVYNEGVVNRRAVTVGRITSAGIEVLSGLAVGDQVVTAGVQQLAENQQVRPWQRERGL